LAGFEDSQDQLLFFMKLPQQSSSPPPQWADKLLEWLCPDELLEEVQGDLQELFEERAAEAGERQARREYILSVLGYLRPYAFKRKTNQSLNPYIQICSITFSKPHSAISGDRRVTLSSILPAFR
jgi:hypothetical protein